MGTLHTAASAADDASHAPPATPAAPESRLRLLVADALFDSPLFVMRETHLEHQNVPVSKNQPQ
jgi:hypothetical protein